MYHGTDLESGEIIIQSQKMCPSRGDHHWLGDGIYFYRDAEYAFRWIVIKYTENFQNSRAQDYKSIFQEYIILTAELNSDRNFNLDDPKTKLFFLKFQEQIKSKSENSKRIQDAVNKSGFSDGVIVNILFEKMGFRNLYDYVSATFPIAYSDISPSRLDFIPELQICVKNAEIVTTINRYCVEDFLYYKEFVDTYKEAKKQLRPKKRHQKQKRTHEEKYYTKKREIK